jgi:hypothetical protein
MSNKKEEENGRPDKAQIDKWKKEHGQLHKITVDEESGNPKMAIVRLPKLRDLKVASSLAGKKTPVDAAQSMLENCALYMDPEIKRNDSLFASAISAMGEIAEVKEAKLEKL